MSTTDLDKKIVVITLQFLGEEDLPTTETIRNTVHDVVEMLQKRKQFSDKEVVDIDKLVKEVETLCNVYFPATSTLDDMHNHQE